MATLVEARLKACRLWPYGASAILSLVPAETPRVQVMAVDEHWRLYVNPKSLAELSIDDAATIILHEVYHLLLNHHERAARLMPADASQADWTRWNYATDFAVNSRLAAEGLQLPNWVETPERHGFAPELSAETYWRLLEPEAPPPGDDGQLRDDNEQAGDQQQPQDSAAELDEQTEPGEEPSDKQSDGAGDPQRGDAGEQLGAGDGQGSPSDGPSSAGDGASGRSPSALSSTTDSNAAPEPWNGTSQPDGESAADGQPREYELGPVTHDAPGLQEHEAAQVIREVAKKIEQKGQDNGRGGMSTWANEIISPRVDPRAALLRAVRKYTELTAGAGDWTYRRPSRRTTGDIIRPGNAQPMPRITVVVDTSGSMDKTDIGLSLGLVGKVLNGFRLREGIKVICYDTAAQTAKKIFAASQIELGGGNGTDMAQAIAYAAEQKPRPQLIVVCTDGYTDWPRQSPGVPVVACITQPSMAHSAPDWMETVSLA